MVFLLDGLFRKSSQNWSYNVEAMNQENWIIKSIITYPILHIFCDIYAFGNYYKHDMFIHHCT